MARVRISRPGLLLLVLCLVLAGGCSSNGDGGESGVAQQQAGAGGEPRVEEFNPDEVIAAQTVTLPARPEDEVTWGLLSLRVEGPVMTLRMAVTPRFGTAGEGERVSLFDCMQRQRFAPVLVDMEHLKEYSVITNGARSWVSGSADTFTANGQTMLAWAVYAAPEDDIDTITVRVADWWPAILDVPIER